MTNEFYSAGRERAAKVSKLFDTVATRYDLMNDLQSFGLHRVWKGKLVSLASIRPGYRALDVCCGTGDISFALARRGASVVGLDFNTRMLAVAEARRQAALKPRAAQRTNPGNLEFVRGDAQAMPFSDDSFDVVTVAYGLRNLASWETGMAEMLRVARPGGRLVVLDFGKPQNALVRSLYFSYLKLFVPMLGRIFCGSAAAYSYILESLKHFPAQRGIEERMHELKMENISIFNLLGGIMSINYGEKPRRPGLAAAKNH